jgi:ketosteroid isomerase-like protein
LRCSRGVSATTATLAIFTASPAFAAPVTPAPVVAAERAFAADGLELGIQGSFLKHSAAEAIVLNPEPTLAHALYAAPKPKGPPLVWWPLWAGIARSGDLGFTTGPYTFDGKPRAYYFTVWAKQPDGGWKWLMDAGPPSDPTGAAPQGSEVTYAKPAARAAGTGAKAMDQVMAAEIALHRAAKTDVAAAFLAAVAEDGRIVGSRAAPPKDRAGLAAELATRPTSIAYSPLGGRASSAGDLAWTYGIAQWTSPDGQAQRGHYVRIWRDDKAGWRILFDELLPAPPAKPKLQPAPAGSPAGA